MFLFQHLTLHDAEILGTNPIYYNLFGSSFPQRHCNSSESTNVSRNVLVLHVMCVYELLHDHFDVYEKQ